MRKLYVENFSSIREADVRVKTLNVIVGPQASGKSVASKLLYFFNDIVSTAFAATEEKKSFSDFNKSVLENFRRLFPPVAWGEQSFKIQYEAGSLNVQLERGRRKTRSNDNISINFSDFFRKQYEAVQDEIEKYELREKSDDLEGILPFSLTLQIRRRVEKRVGADFTSGQTFIPAGRSYFSSIGKAIVAFEHSGLLDPITVRFGRRFTQLRERGILGLRSEDDDANALALEFFGGRIKLGRDRDYVQLKDGRRLPFSLLSSGQQELLPLWTILQSVAHRPIRNHIFYIEEPEAHLFPASQNKLLEFLVAFIGNKISSHMLITTHSPYVLAKLNNLLKAGAIADQFGQKIEPSLSKIILKQHRLRSKSVSALAIKDGVFSSIIDEDGLIDGNYLDAVSGDTAREFMSLLEIEVNERS